MLLLLLLVLGHVLAVLPLPILLSWHGVGGILGSSLRLHGLSMLMRHLLLVVVWPCLRLARLHGWSRRMMLQGLLLHLVLLRVVQSLLRRLLDVVRRLVLLCLKLGLRGTCLWLLHHRGLRFACAIAAITGDRGLSPANVWQQDSKTGGG